VGLVGVCCCWVGGLVEVCVCVCVVCVQLEGGKNLKRWLATHNKQPLRSYCTVLKPTHLELQTNTGWIYIGVYYSGLFLARRIRF
jgi:hypothetical protein